MKKSKVQQAQAELAQAQAELSATEKLAQLDQAASFQALVASCKDELAAIRDGWSTVLDAIASIDAKVKLQKLAAEVAQGFANENGLRAEALVLGHEPLVAHSMLNMSELPWPAVMRPVFYVSQFPKDQYGNQPDLWMNIQLTLNNGQPVHASGSTSETIARALLNGMRPGDVQSAPFDAVKTQSSMGKWFGFNPRAA